jgi:hypothetical protein
LYKSTSDQIYRIYLAEVDLVDLIHEGRLIDFKPINPVFQFLLPYNGNEWVPANTKGGSGITTSNN